MVSNTEDSSLTYLLPPLAIEHGRFSDSLPLSMLTHRTFSEPPIGDNRSNTIAGPHKKHIGRGAHNTRLFEIEGAHSPVVSSFKSRLKAVVFDPFDSRVTRWTRESHFHGWRMGGLCSCCISSLILCCNLTIIAIAATSGSGYNAQGISNMIVGDEAFISRWNTLLHILINALSTILLAGSNYTMQVLSSPTRQDVDSAHANRDRLEIGLLSPRNLREIPGKRVVLWYG